MPTVPFAGTPQEDGPPPPPDGDDLVFAAHDLGRDRPLPPPRPDEGVEFAMAPRPGEIPPPPPPPPPAPPAGSLPAAPTKHDGFVIREPVDVPQAPVDALVVGAPVSPAAPRPIATKAEFRIHSSPDKPSAAADADSEPWTVREVAPASMSASKGWTARKGGLSERSTQETVRRLREDAVHTSWRAAWVAMTSADNQLFKERQAR